MEWQSLRCNQFCTHSSKIWRRIGDFDASKLAEARPSMAICFDSAAQYVHVRRRSLGSSLSTHVTYGGVSCVISRRLTKFYFSHSNVQNRSSRCLLGGAVH